jgi:hypothetical protein
MPTKTAGQTKCGECGILLFDGDNPPPEIGGPVEGREPCPKCGSKKRAFEAGIAEFLAISDMVGKPRVIRGLNEIRVAALLALLGVAVAVGSTAGFQQSSVLAGMIWGIGAFFVGAGFVALLYRWSWLRAKTMSAMHALTGK